MNYQIELFHSLLNDFVVGESALLTVEGEVLAIRGKKPATYGTLTTAAHTTCKYLKLQEGDIAILNDPYSGGSILSELTFIVAISEDLLWVVRRPFAKGIKLVKSIEEEGIRIPPTPILQKGILNEMILSAIQAHPVCHPRFSEWLKEQIDDLTLKSKKIFEAIEFTGFTITSELIEDYIKLCKQAAVRKISEKAAGETRVDVTLDSGELLRLNLEINDGKISIDFSGSSASKSVALTENAVFGACYYALSQFYDFTDLTNSGTFSILQVTQPTGCWLLSKYPSSTYKGMTAGIAAIQSAMEQALSKIHSKSGTIHSSFCPVQVDLLSEKENFFMEFAGGTGATHSEHGCDVFLKPFSIEQLEEKFPIKVSQVSRRERTHGNGKYSGGRGISFDLEFRENLNTSWVTDLTSNKPKLEKNSTQGDSGKIELWLDGKEEKISFSSRQLIQKGSILKISSGNGGNYGKPEKVEQSDDQ